MKGAGGDFGVLLAGNGSYAVKTQDASGPSFGAKRQAHPPVVHKDLASLIEKGVEVFVVQDDAADRGLESGDLIGGVKRVPRVGVGKLFGNYDQIWHW